MNLMLFISTQILASVHNSSCPEGFSAPLRAVMATTFILTWPMQPRHAVPASLYYTHSHSQARPGLRGGPSGWSTGRVWRGWQVFCVSFFISPWMRRKSMRPVKRSRPRLAARTELLVDADIHSIQEIRQAIECLEERSQQVRTQLFAPPKRVENKKWGQLMRKAGIKFRPVRRSTDALKEANDEAIEAEIHNLASDTHVDCIALMTTDTDFVKTLEVLKVTGANCLVLVPGVGSQSFNAIHRFRERGLDVLHLQSVKEESGPKVQAILHSDGGGSVKLVARHVSVDPGDRRDMVMGFLSDLGFLREKGYLTPACAKFWLTNHLGSLIVYPDQPSTFAVEEIATQSVQKHSWARYENQLALFIPRVHKGRATGRQLKTYGSAFARSIFRGGGPFMLEDSACMTEIALKRLGYLDDLNPDEHEAMFTFVNSASNKKTLRKMNLLPDLAESSDNVKEKLRTAFLSNESSGHWAVSNDSDGSRLEIQQILVKEQLLCKSQLGCSSREMFDAMKAYVKKYQLI